MWARRLQDESRNSYSQFFVTLTYDETFVPRNRDGLMVVSKRDVRLFIMSLRKYCKKFGLDLRYYVAAEYSPELLRPHYHCILFNIPIGLSETPHDIVQRFWKHGFVQCGPLKDGGGNYAAKYICQPFDYDLGGRTPCFSWKSKGLGKAILTDKLKNYCLQHDTYSIKVSPTDSINLCRYYREKIIPPERLKKMSSKVTESFQQSMADDFAKDYAASAGQELLYHQRRDKQLRDIKTNLKKYHKRNGL